MPGATAPRRRKSRAAAPASPRCGDRRQRRLLAVHPGQLAADDRLRDPLVAVQQPQRDPLSVRQSGTRPVASRSVSVSTARRTSSLHSEIRVGRHSSSPVATRCTVSSSARSPRPNRALVGHDRHAQFARKLLVVDRQPVALGLVHQVQADDRPVGDLQHLQHEVQIALKPRGVDHDDGHVRLAEQDEVAGDLLVVARGQQRVRARQVDELEPVAVVSETRPRPGRRSCPASCPCAAAGRSGR